MHTGKKYTALFLLMAFLCTIGLNALSAHKGYVLHKGKVEVFHNEDHPIVSENFFSEETEDDTEGSSEVFSFPLQFVLFYFFEPLPLQFSIPDFQQLLNADPIFLSIRVLRI